MPPSANKSSHRRWAVAAVAVVMAVLDPGHAVADPGTDAGLTARQRQAIEALIRDYIRQNPEEIIESVTRHQA